MLSSSTVGAAWKSSPLTSVGFIARGRPESGLSLALREAKRMSLWEKSEPESPHPLCDCTGFL